jgi:hypothetical protein
MTTKTAVTDGAAMTIGQLSECEPQQVLQRWIGTTDYMVTVRFGSNTKEPLEQNMPISI